MTDRDPVVTLPFGRRQFLTTAAGAAASVLVCGRAGSADAPAPSGRRALSFLNTHTGEKRLRRVLGRRRISCRRPGRDRPRAARPSHGRSPLDRPSVARRPARAAPRHRHERALQRDLLLPVAQSNAALRRAGRAVAPHSLHMEGKAADVRLPGSPSTTCIERRWASRPAASATTPARPSCTSTSAASATGRRAYLVAASADVIASREAPSALRAIASSAAASPTKWIVRWRCTSDPPAGSAAAGEEVSSS